MQSDRQQTLNSYLKNIVADGSKPFRYRSGVRSLLGIPDSEGGDLALSPILPPAAFRYTHHLFMGEPYATHHSSYESGRSGSCSEQGNALEGYQAIHREYIQDKIPVKERETGIPHVSEKSRHDSVNRGVVRDRALTGNATQSAAMPESKQEEVLTEPVEKRENPDAAIESARIEIPGASERKTSFFPLSQKEGLTQLGKTEKRAQKEMLQTGSGKNSVREFFSEAKEDAQTVNPATTAKSSLEMLRRTEIIKEKPAIIPSPGITKHEELEEVTTVTAEANKAEKNEFSQGIVRHPAGGSSVKSRKFRPDQTLAPSPSQNPGLAFTNRLNRNAAGKIDQLRHA
ncbi:MAG: hypothetical protein KAR13_20745, partial [Desulfobulbaceae bacterium]|nr:hypothetical protein [Desulfobulbaceae bacterium]